VAPPPFAHQREVGVVLSSFFYSGQPPHHSLPRKRAAAFPFFFHAHLLK
jgi:hypothetical protein